MIEPFPAEIEETGFSFSGRKIKKTVVPVIERYIFFAHKRRACNWKIPEITTYEYVRGFAVAAPQPDFLIFSEIIPKQRLPVLPYGQKPLLVHHHRLIHPDEILHLAGPFQVLQSKLKDICVTRNSHKIKGVDRPDVFSKVYRIYVNER